MKKYAMSVAVVATVVFVPFVTVFASDPNEDTKRFGQSHIPTVELSDDDFSMGSLPQKRIPIHPKGSSWLTSFLRAQTTDERISTVTKQSDMITTPREYVVQSSTPSEYSREKLLQTRLQNSRNEQQEGDVNKTRPQTANKLTRKST